MTEYRFYQDITVRYGDLDPQGHVNNATYLTYLEHARTSYLYTLGLWDGHSFSDIGIIIAEIRITYKAPILLGQKIRVGVCVPRIGNKSFVMSYRIEDVSSGASLAEAESVQVAYDYRRSETIPISPSWRQAINAFEMSPDANIPQNPVKKHDS
ncbi:MAG: thioesterase family protein [Anaerolineales bacterium]